jgi:cytochrome c553
LLGRTFGEYDDEYEYGESQVMIPMTRFKILAGMTWLLAAFSLLANTTVAGEPALDLFEKSIRPTLIAKCLRCHGTEKQEGGLQLDSRRGWMTGGDTGPAILPGRPSASLLLKAIRYEGDLEMPPDGKLPERTIAAFEKWVDQGAPDPREASPQPDKRRQGNLIEEGRDFWSFKPIHKPSIPPVENKTWPHTDIDRFILARLEQQGLEPVTDADTNSLVRRLYFDLTGLPPTSAQMDEFLHDPSPEEYLRLVDRLLETRHFGERWGRHWLDVVRFAESSGGGRTLLFPDAWRYRDYVIDAFNEDVPFDRFVAEQIAGDLLDFETTKEHRRNLTATAFLLLGPTNYEMQDKDILEMDIVDEQLDTIGKSMLGMTIGCARCHDHKFDPIPTRDYYALAGILKSTKFVTHDNVSAWNTVTLPLPPEEEEAVRAAEQRIESVKKELAAARARLKEGGHTDLKTDVGQLEARLKRLTADSPPRPVAMATADLAEPADIPIAIRGVTHQQGPIVKRGVLQVAAPSGFPPIATDSSGRLELAQWIVNPANPLTARVMANRVWHWLIGQGIVRTVDNFGAMGELPSHAELLDYLAATLAKEGWSVKQLVRTIVSSRVYQLSAENETNNHQADPENRLCWRMNRRRLEAEEIRDALLFVSGQLDLTYGGSSIKTGTKKEYGYQFDSVRRSVYLPVFRNRLPEIFEVFDFSDPNVQGGRRTTSTIAPQALLLMNHPFVIQQSRLAAARLQGENNFSAPDLLEHAYRQVLGRGPSERETAAGLAFLEHGDGANIDHRCAMLYQTLFQSIDFRYLN